MSELNVRITLAAAAGITVLAVSAAWLGGPSAGLGVLASGVLTVVNFLWLARSATAVGPEGVSRVRAGGWALAFGGRFAVLALGFGALLASGWAHPLAVVAGLVIVPCVVIAAGLGAARTAHPGS